LHDSKFDQQFTETADVGLEVIHCQEHQFPWFRFSLLVVVLALGLARLVAVCPSPETDTSFIDEFNKLA
jgi:hypothetical protein